jgi:hypothetical protein
MRYASLVVKASYCHENADDIFKGDDAPVMTDEERANTIAPLWQLEDSPM